MAQSKKSKRVLPPPRYVKGGPKNCPHCLSVNLGAMYLRVINLTIIGCRDCHKLKMTLPGEAK